MPGIDEAHRQTDEALRELERRISEEFGRASREMRGEVEAYFESFRKRDARQRELLRRGKITEEQYRQWRLNQMGRGKRLEVLRDKLAERMTRANEAAAAYMNDATPGIYSLNRNYAAYTIEQATGYADFALWDEQTVRRLARERPDLMPYYPPERAVRRGIDLAYGRRQITAQVTSGILLGEGLGQLADRLCANIPSMGRDSAIRTARTAVTGAENAGRLESYSVAARMGIGVRKEWLATLDGRTRHSHAALDGVRIDPDGTFSNGCRYPGDPQGPPGEVYNCRCRLIADIGGVDMSDAKRWSRDPATGRKELVPNMSYAEWMASKRRQ